MKRFEKFCIGVCLFVCGFCVFQLIPEASAQVISTYVRKAGDTMSGMLRFSTPGSTNAINVPSLGRIHWGTGNDALYIYGQTGQGVFSGTGFNAPSITTSAGSGVNGINFSTNGARMDLGTGASDYFRSDGSSVLTPANLSFATSQFSTAPALGTCALALEGQLVMQNGGTSGSRNKLCLCTSDGGGTPAYAWLNISTLLAGTATTCL